MSASSEATLTSKDTVLREVWQYAHELHTPKPFRPGVDFIPYAGQVFDGSEIMLAADALLQPWITMGKFTRQFEAVMAEYLGVKASVFVNSGSSANLLALAALTSEKLKDERLEAGDEVITVAAGFPTTVNPILQCGLVPVLVDVDPRTGNVRTDMLEAATSPRTRAVMLSHALGQPFDVDEVVAFCKEYNLWLIEDNCDALGSTYHGKLTGTFGQLSTQSFYPPHHITTGEGGMVNVSSPRLKRIVESFRDWGRDCWCDTTINACGKRFSQQHGDLPYGYDHRYTYSHIGYNLKALDLQGAIGCKQMERLAEFTAQRRHNWQRLSDGMAEYDRFFELPYEDEHSIPSWFAYMVLLRPDAPFKRHDLMAYMEAHKVGVRMFFGGNLVRQPAYKNAKMKVVGDLAGSDRMMNDAFFLGVYPGLTDAHIDYMVETIGGFIRG